MSSVFAQPAPHVPSYDKDTAGALAKGDGGEAKVRNPGNGAVKGDATLEANLMAIIQPRTSDDGGFLGDVLRNVSLAAIILYLVIAGAQLVVSGNKAEDLKTALKNLGFIVLGAVLIYGAGWLFGQGGVIDFSTPSYQGGTQGLEGVAKNLSEGNSSFLFQILSLVKGAAFFFAILMIVWTGFKVITAADGDKSQKLVRGVLNVVAALVIMKVVDFVYYIASANDFAAQATDFILRAAKFCAFVYGIIAVLMVFYAGYSFLTDG
jgi:hypothetical protein